jgi:hypothetical protein
MPALQPALCRSDILLQGLNCSTAFRTESA